MSVFCIKVWRLMSFGLIGGLLFHSCGALVNYDFKKDTDFSKLKGYNYFSDMQTGLSGLDTKRIVLVLDHKLTALGLKKVAVDSADFYIDIQSIAIENANATNFGFGVGNTVGNFGNGISIGIPIRSHQKQREVILEFVSKDTKTVLWQALAKSTYKTNASPQQRDLYFEKLMDKILKKYPPK